MCPAHHYDGLLLLQQQPDHPLFSGTTRLCVELDLSTFDGIGGIEQLRIIGWQLGVELWRFAALQSFVQDAMMTPTNMGQTRW